MVMSVCKCKLFMVYFHFIFTLHFVESSSEATTEPLIVQSVDYLVAENAIHHHTNDYEITQSKEARLVIRRGHPFEVNVKFNRPYDAEQDQVRIIMEIGKLHFKSAIGILYIPYGPSPYKRSPGHYKSLICVSVIMEYMQIIPHTGSTSF